MLKSEKLEKLSTYIVNFAQKSITQVLIKGIPLHIGQFSPQIFPGIRGSKMENLAEIRLLVEKNTGGHRSCQDIPVTASWLGKHLHSFVLVL